MLRGVRDKVTGLTFVGFALKRDSPPELFPGDDAVVVGEKLLLDGALNVGQQSTDAAGRRSRFG